jgi:hypothetical protein
MRANLTGESIGELRVMFNQEDEQSAFIDKFFEKKPNPGISWLHAVAKEDYGDAHAALYEEAGKANNLEVKHVSSMILAIRLCSVTDLRLNVAYVKLGETGCTCPVARDERTSSARRPRWYVSATLLFKLNA